MFHKWATAELADQAGTILRQSPPGDASCHPRTCTCIKCEPETDEPTPFANWYCVHGIPLGIGRDNAKVIYDAAISEYEKVSERLADACRLAKDYEAIHLNGGIGYCITIKTKALDAIADALAQYDASKQ
jgi:hypothetical protein